jgi:gluconolactonase
VICLLAAVSAACAADVPKPTGDAIVAADAKLEPLFTWDAPEGGGMTEGPAAAPDGSIYFSGIPFAAKVSGTIFRFDPKTKKTTPFTEDSHKSNGLAFDGKGRLVVCEGANNGGRCISRYDVKTGKREVLTDNLKGKKFNSPNDLAIDTKGRIYFSDPRYVGTEPRELERQGVYRLDPDGAVVEAVRDVEKANGVRLSPDGKTLYVADTNNGSDPTEKNDKPPKKGAMKLYAFPLGDDGSVKGDRKTLVDFGDEDGVDGLALDVKGNLYLAVRSLKRPGILVVDPAGKEVAFIPTAAPQPGAKDATGIPSNCVFGQGDEASTLYVTIDKGLYRIKLKVDGYHLPLDN